MNFSCPGNNLYGKGRVLVWFSCGAASAVAAKIAVDIYGQQYDLEVLYCDTLKYEHPDNRRFMSDVSNWIGRDIKIIKSSRFADIFDVFMRMRFLNGPNGAPCTTQLKKNVRKEYQQPEDLHIFGFTSDEQDRIESFEDDNHSLRLRWILRDNGVTKKECFRILTKAGIALPAMYRLGYKNNNCIGCVKGGAGYWNKIRRDFPEAFCRMARLERELNYALCRVNGQPCFLDELPENAGRYGSEPDIECGPQCLSVNLTGDKL